MRYSTIPLSKLCNPAIAKLFEHHILRVLILFTILALPLYLVRFSIFGVPTNVLEVLVIATAGATLWHARHTRTKDSTRRFLQYFLQHSAPPRIVLAAWALMTVGALLSTAAGGAWHTGLGIVKGWLVVPFVFLLCVHYALRHAIISRIHIFRALIVGGAFVAAVAVIYASLNIFTYDHRLRAFYLSPNHLAMTIAPIIPLVLGGLLLAYKRHERIRVRVFLIVSLMTLCGTLYLTRSLGGMSAALGGALFFLGTFYRSPRIFIGALLAAALTSALVLVALWHTPRVQDFFAQPERSSLASRMIIWRSAWHIGTDHPLLGIGPGNFQKYYLDYQRYYPPYLEWAVPQPHNLFLALWLQTGLLGFSGFVLLLGNITTRATSLVRTKTHTPQEIITRATLGAFATILIHGLIDTPYWKNDLAVIFWLLVILALPFTFRQDKNS